MQPNNGNGGMFKGRQLFNPDNVSFCCGPEGTNLPQNIVDALLAANAPSAGNPFATIADIGGMSVNIYNTDDAFTGDRLADLGAAHIRP